MVDDIFRVNWIVNARFRGGKVYVVRLNPDTYELSGEQHVQGPTLVHRLALVFRHLYDLCNPPAGYLRIVYR